jgi:plasmid maintenance system antidote protein VapI
VRLNFDSDLKTFDAVGHLRDNVRLYLEDMNITQRSLADAVGVSEQTICDFLAGRRDLRSDTFGRLSILTSNPMLFQRPLRSQFSQSKNALVVNLQEQGQGKRLASDIKACYRTQRNHEKNLQAKRNLPVVPCGEYTAIPDGRPNSTLESRINQSVLTLTKGK